MHPVRIVPNAWIPLADGTRLAARLWLPEGAAPAPAILEYLPYRKADALAVRDHGHAAWLASRGFAFARVDLRGTGDSDGLLLDEYAPQELADGVEVVAWLAAQDWCSGAVALFGNSWGGFNGLQIAALRPPALRAVVSCHSTDDRYADDVHYYGGCLLALEMLSWATWMLPLNALPPDPRTVGEGWRDAWLARLEGTPPFAHAWIAHQRRDAYWRHGSVCEDPAAIACPVLMADVRARVAEKRARRAYGEDPAAVEFALALDESPLARLSRLAVIAGRRETMEASGRLGPVITLARRATVKAISPFLSDVLAQVNSFNAALVAHLRELQDAHEQELERERDRRVVLEARVAELERCAESGG